MGSSRAYRKKKIAFDNSYFSRVSMDEIEALIEDSTVHHVQIGIDVLCETLEGEDVGQISKRMEKVFRLYESGKLCFIYPVRDLIETAFRKGKITHYVVSQIKTAQLIQKFKRDLGVIHTDHLKDLPRYREIAQDLAKYDKQFHEKILPCCSELEIDSYLEDLSKKSLSKYNLQHLEVFAASSNYIKKINVKKFQKTVKRNEDFQRLYRIFLARLYCISLPKSNPRSVAVKVNDWVDLCFLYSYYEATHFYTRDKGQAKLASILKKLGVLKFEIKCF